MSGSSEFLFPTLERHLKFKFKFWRILKNWLKTIRVLGITYSVSDVTSIFNCVVFPSQTRSFCTINEMKGLMQGSPSVSRFVPCVKKRFSKNPPISLQKCQNAPFLNCSATPVQYGWTLWIHRLVHNCAQATGAWAGGLEGRVGEKEIKTDGGSVESGSWSV